MPWRKKWQQTPIFLLGNSHGQRSLAGYSPWGRKRVEYDFVTKQQPPLMIKLVQKAFTILTKPGYVVTLLGSTSGELLGTQIICWGQFTTSASKVQWNTLRDHVNVNVKVLSRVRLFATPWTVAWLLHPWDFPGKSTGVGCHFLLQEIFLTQGLNPGSLIVGRSFTIWATKEVSNSWIHNWHFNLLKVWPCLPGQLSLLEI